MPRPEVSDRLGRTRFDGPDTGEMAAAARALAQVCARNGGNAADLAIVLGAVGFLGTDEALEAAETLTEPPVLCAAGLHRVCPDNTYTRPDTGRRECRACARKRRRDRKQAARGAQKQASSSSKIQKGALTLGEAP